MRCMTDPVLLHLTDGVATITLNRPEAMNSLDVATKQALLDAVRSVAEDPAARCVVLTGTGRAFCVGQDLKQHIEILDSADSDQLFRTVEEHYNPIVTTLVGMAKPVVAAVNGVAAGAGASLAFACDLRIVADTAGFNLAFAGVALSCDTGSSFTLQRLSAPPGRSSCSTSRAPSRPTKLSRWGSPRGSWPPMRSPTKYVHSRRRWRPDRRWRTEPCVGQLPTPPVTPSRRPSRSRAR
jgi:enoyl-CoA hydratase/carnithine racemase